MLTPEDINNLTEFQKTVFVTKDDLKGLEDKVDKVQTSLDAVLKRKSLTPKSAQLQIGELKTLKIG